MTEMAPEAYVPDAVTPECRCGKPTRDSAYFCDDCGHQLSVALGDVPWLDEELDVSTARIKGANYAGASSKGAETPSPVNWGASEAKSHLRAVLVSWARFCDEERVRNASPHPGLPADNLPALSRWLLWRVDGLSLLDIGPEAVDEITDAVKRAHRQVDRPADRQYLGNCDICPEGRLYARPGGSWARCDTCDQATEAQAIRDRMLRELDDRLCTAAEIAHLSTYLGLVADRETVRKRINQWASRGKLVEHASFSDEPTYRFGAVYEMLAKAEYSTREGAA